MSMLRKIFVTGVMLSTVLSLCVVAAPTASAAASAGDLIKMNGLSSVYYLGANGKRYVFPNEATYFSWYKDFSGIVTVSQSELETYPLAANVVIRPGTKMVKSPSSSMVYAVEPNGVLRSIVSEANAIALWGADWNKKVVDVIDAFFTNYTIGTPLTVGKYPAGQLFKTSGSADVYLVSTDGKARKFASEASFVANSYSFNYVATASSAFTMPSTGTTVSGREDSLADVSQGGASGHGPVAGTGISIALASDTPASQSIPAGAGRIELMKFNVTASNDGAVSLNNITIKRSGLGSKADFPTIWLEKNGTRITAQKSINNNDESLLTIAPALVVEAGKTVSISVFGSVYATPGANDMLSIVSASSIDASGASVSGSFPISSNLMSFATGYTVSPITFTKGGSTGSYSVGDEGVDVGNFVLSSGTRDLSFKKITLKQNGNAELSQVLGDVYLEKSGIKVSESTTIDGKYITFVLADSGLLIEKSDSVTFKIKASIIDMDSSNNNVTLALKNNEDLTINEVSTGYSATVSGATTLYAYTLTAGNVTVSKTNDSPTAKSYVKNTKDVTLLRANLKAAQEFTADGMRLDLVTPTSTVGGFENVRLYLNGVLVDSIDPVNGNDYLTYDSAVSVKQGSNIIEVKADVKSDAVNGDNITVKLDSTYVFDTPVYSNDDAVTVDGTATAAKVTVATATLTATRSDGFSSTADGSTSEKNIVKGTSGAVLAKVTLKAMNDDIDVNSIVLSAIVAGSGTEISDADVTNIMVMVGDSQIGGTKDFTASGATINLGSDKIHIAQGATKVVTILGTIESSADTADQFQTTMSFNATDSNGKDLTGSTSVSSARFYVASSGTLTVAKDGNTRIASLLSASTGANEIATFKLTATNDDLRINKIYMSNVKGTGTDNRISSIDLYSGSTLLGTTVPTNGEVYYDLSSSPLTVEANKSVTLTAKISLNDITSADQSGNHIQLALTGISADSSSGVQLTNSNNALAFDYAAAFSDSTEDLAATSTNSATTLTTTADTTWATGTVIMIDDEQMLVTAVNTVTLTVTRAINGTAAVAHNNGTTISTMSSIAANDFIVRKTIPTISLQTLPSSVLTTGDQTIFKFTVSADANSDVTVRSFQLALTNIGTTFASTAGTLKVNGSNYTTATVTADNATSSAASKVDINLSSSPVVVSAGTSKTIEVVLNVSSINTTNGATASVTAKINQDSATTATTAGTTTFGWSDNADVTNYASTIANSFEVPGLPTATLSLHN